MANENLNLSIENMLPQITEQVAAELRKRALASLEYQTTEAVRAEVQSYIQENILPAVRVELAQHDAELKALFVAAVRGSVAVLAESAVANATKKMGSYDGDKLLGKVLGELFGRGY